MHRRVRDESGMAMGIVIIMIVLIGVLGAGLLTFVRTDLTAVAEVNQGQRAFEMADAGVQAARRHFATPGNAVATMYDGTTVDNSTWAYNVGSPAGVELRNLDASGTTDDRVRVTIQNTSATTFRVTSAGTYGAANRKIEAVFKVTNGTARGIQAYYTPGTIDFADKIKVVAVSMFSKSNIVLKDYKFSYYPPGNQSGETGDTIQIVNGTADPLNDWDTTNDSPPEFWNTVPRLTSPTDSTPITSPGFAAEGFICSSSGCGSPDRIADGKYGYDSTTGTKGNKKKFFDKVPPQKNPNGTDGGTPARDIITYPFSRTPPDADALIALAKTYVDGGKDKYVDLRAGDSLNWDELYPDASDRVVFIDANGSSISTSFANNSRGRGILVVRCGTLTLNQNFQGVVIVLKGEDGVHGSGCSDKAQYKSNKANVQGYVYAEGDNPSQKSIEITSESEIGPLPSGQNYLLELSGLNRTSNVMKLQSWRELYQ